MKHDLKVEKFGVRLRPVNIKDAAFILKLRTSQEFSKYIGDTSSNIENQIAWLRNYLQRENDFYFCIETHFNEPIGTIGLYNITSSEAEWGRWIVYPNSLAAPASAYLIYYIAFEIIKLDRVYCKTVSENEKVISFHRSCGLKQVGFEENAVTINNQKYSLIIQSLEKEQWSDVAKKLERISTIIGR